MKPFGHRRWLTMIIIICSSLDDRFDDMLSAIRNRCLLLSNWAIDRSIWLQRSIERGTILLTTNCYIITAATPTAWSSNYWLFHGLGIAWNACCHCCCCNCVIHTMQIDGLFPKKSPPLPFNGDQNWWTHLATKLDDWLYLIEFDWKFVSFIQHPAYFKRNRSNYNCRQRTNQIETSGGKRSKIVRLWCNSRLRQVKSRIRSLLWMGWTMKRRERWSPSIIYHWFWWRTEREWCSCERNLVPNYCSLLLTLQAIWSRRRMCSDSLHNCIWIYIYIQPRLS